VSDFWVVLDGTWFEPTKGLRGRSPDYEPRSAGEITPSPRESPSVRGGSRLVCVPPYHATIGREANPRDGGVI